MPQTNIQEILRKGGEFYNASIKEFEPENNGKYVVIDIDSGKHFIGDTRDEATAKARVEFPEKIMFIKRIGQIEKISRHLLHSCHKYA